MCGCSSNNPEGVQSRARSGNICTRLVKSNSFIDSPMPRGNTRSPKGNKPTRRPANRRALPFVKGFEMKRTLLRAGTPVLAFAGLALIATAVPGAAVAATGSAVEYVSPTGASAGADTSCATAAFTDINAAVAAAPTGSTVILCKGTYKTSVTVDKRLTLQGEAGAIINAKGQPYG